MPDRGSPTPRRAGRGPDRIALLLPGLDYLPGIWLTPILRDSPMPADLRRAAAPFLLVGSTADPSWDPEIARSFGQPLFEARDADHGMETVDDPVNSADLLRQVTVAMDGFVGTL